MAKKKKKVANKQAASKPAKKFLSNASPPAPKAQQPVSVKLDAPAMTFAATDHLRALAGAREVAEDEAFVRDLSKHEKDQKLVVALGTSITWGQGLSSPNKAVVRLAHLLGAKTTVASYANSGAILVPPEPIETDHTVFEPKPALRDPTVPTIRYRLFESPLSAIMKENEIPNAPVGHRRTNSWYADFADSTPYIYEQACCAHYDLAREELRATHVVIDAGANDIGFLFTIMANDPIHAAMHMNEVMTGLKPSLRSLLLSIAQTPTFQGAVIMLTGYAEAITKHTEEDRLQAWPLIQLALQFLRYTWGGHVGTLVHMWRTNMKAFFNIVNRALYEVVENLREEHKELRDQLFFVDPKIPRDRPMFGAKTPAFWPNPKEPLDELYGLRQVRPPNEKGHDLFQDLSDNILLRVNSFAHPNVDGAGFYVDAMLETATKKIQKPFEPDLD